MSRPIVVGIVDPQSLEEFTVTLEDFLKGRDEQAFAEASRAGEEINFPLRYKPVNPGRFIHVEIAPLSNLAEGLYPYRQWLEHRPLSPLRSRQPRAVADATLRRAPPTRLRLH